MNVDLLSALEARRAEQPETATRAGGDAFPSVLRSNLDGSRDASSSAGAPEDASVDRSRQEDRAAERGAASEREEASAGQPRSNEAEARTDNDRQQTRDASSPAERDREGESAREREDEPDRERGRGDDRDENVGRATAGASDEMGELAENMGEGAVLGVAGAVVADDVRPSLEVSASEAGQGRISALDVDGQRAGRDVGQRAAEAGETSGAFVDEPVDEEVSAQAKAVLEGAREGAAVLDEGPVGSETARAAAGPSESAPTLDAARSSEETPVELTLASAPEREDTGDGESRSGSEERSEAPPDARTENEQAAFDRAAEGALSGGVDPSLREAISRQEEVQRAPDAIPVVGGIQAPNPVAGAVTETTPATPGVPQPAVASDAISVQTEWLATRGGGSARLLLHPPELGEIAIRVTLRAGAVDVVMVAQEAVAQSVAEEQSDRLAQALQSRDLRMEQFEVRRGDPETLGDETTGRFAESGEERDGGQRSDGGGETAGSETARGLLGRSGAAPESAPRILAAGPEAGVDLRI